MPEEILRSNVSGLMLEDVGRIRLFQGSDPAANAEITETVPAGVAWKLKSVFVQLAQGATQTPLPLLLIDDGTNNFVSSPGMAAALNASVTAFLCWAPGMPVSGGGASTAGTGPLPADLYLLPGYRIKTSTIGKGANTDYGRPQIFVVEYNLL